MDAMRHFVRTERIAVKAFQFLKNGPMYLPVAVGVEAPKVCATENAQSWGANRRGKVQWP
jgi:hypothetical protein